MTPPPRKHRRFQFTLRKLLAFMLLCVLFFAYTAWWMGRLRLEQERAKALLEAARQREVAARVRAEQARDQARAHLRRAQQARELMRLLHEGNEDTRGEVTETIRRVLLEELDNPTVDPGAVDLFDRW